MSLPENFVGYFGTHLMPGHYLYVLDGGKDLSESDIRYWAGEFDEDWIMAQLSEQSIKVFYWTSADVTICGYPRSLDDDRPGSKSLFIVKGDHSKDYEYIVQKMKSFSWVYEIFEKLVKKYLED